MTVHTPWARLGLVSCCLIILGCAVPHSYYCDDDCGLASISGRYSDGGPVAGAPCGTGCTTCGAVAAPVPMASACDSCSGGCSEGGCFEGGCSDCGCGVVGPVCGLKGLLARAFTCKSGCDRVYWGEWTFDPPDKCDPCNHCGDYVGPRDCGPGGWCKFWLGLHGQRFYSGGCDGGCGSLYDSDCGCSGGGGQLGPVLHDSMDMPGQTEMLDEFPMEDVESVVPTARRPYYQQTTRSCLTRNPTR